MPPTQPPPDQAAPGHRPSSPTLATGLVRVGLGFALLVGTALVLAWLGG